MEQSRCVIVTGGAGYIGSHVCKALALDGYYPITYDNLTSGHRSSVRWGPLIEGSIHDIEHLSSVCGTYNPIAVFHLASHINVRESFTDPVKYYHNNTQGTLCVLQAMIESGVKKLIFSSTASIFGHSVSKLIDEKHPRAPLHPYGKSKLMAEMIIEDFARLHSMHTVCLRYFNACGADSSAEIGEAHLPETHLIPLAIQTALGKRDILEIYGGSYPTPDGTAIRDYVHVSDLAAAHVKALEWLMTSRASLSLNLGTGSGYSVLQIIEEVESITQKKIPKIIKEAAADSPVLIASAALANEILNWHPKDSTLSNMIQTALVWHTK